MNRKGTLLIFTAAVVWGMAGIFVKRLEAYGVSSAASTFYRCFFTAVIIGAVMLFVDRSGFFIKLRDLWLFAANGIFSIVLFSFSYYKTIRLSTLSIAAVLLYTAPVFVMIMSIFLFGEKLTVKKVIALIMAVSGCALVSGVFNAKVRISAVTLVFGLLTGLGYALYTIFSNMLILRGYKPFTIIFYTFSFASLGAAALVVFTGTEGMRISGGVLLWGVLLAALNSVLPYLLYTYGLKHIDASKAPIVATVEPVAATVLGLFYGEKLSVLGAIGIIAVLGSVVIINIGKGENHES